MTLTENGLFHFVVFINGGSDGAAFWREAGPAIRQAAAGWLRRRSVLDPFNRVDVNAIDDVEGEVQAKLFAMAKHPERNSFDLARIRYSPQGLAGWLGRIVSNCVISYCRVYHGARKSKKTVSLEGLDFNPAMVSDAGASTLDKVIRREGIARVTECMNRLPDDEQFLLQQVFYEGVSRRALARKLGITPSDAWRRVNKATDHLLMLLAT